MQKSNFITLSCLAAIGMAFNPLQAEPDLENTNLVTLPKENSFSPFTGKISRNKVRMRLQPNLDSAVLKELNKDDLLIVVSENEDFYGVQAPSDLKAYVYRTFVLDNVVEGSHVNVRLEPNLEAPVIVQLNSGDSVDGTISPINSKWLEITTPKTIQFFVAKDFVEKLGDPTLIETMAKRRESVNRLLESTYQISELELEKPYQQIEMNGIFQNLNKIIADKNNQTEQIDRARSMLTSIQDKYLQKKIAFLEEKPEKLYFTKSENNNENSFITNASPESNYKNPITAKMNVWLPSEEIAYQSWAVSQTNPSTDDFYKEEKEQATRISGRIEAYDRSVKNKPGDFILVNHSNHLPIAYLYSTLINLTDLLGEEVTLEVSPRPNNSFAFPAYFVLKVNQ